MKCVEILPKIIIDNEYESSNIASKKEIATVKKHF